MSRARTGLAAPPVPTVVLLLTAGAAAAGAALAGARPTGTPVVDPLYEALLAFVVVVAGARANRGAVLWLGVAATALARGWLIAPAAASLLLAFTATLAKRPRPLLGAVTAALAVQVVLRWDVRAFQGATALAGAAALGPVLISALRRSPRHVRHRVWLGLGTLTVAAVVVVIPAAVSALAARHQVEDGIAQAQDALHQVSSGDAQTVRQELATAASDFAGGSARLGAWWTHGARLVPFAAQQRQALTVGVRVAEDVAVTADQQATRIDFSQIRYSSGGVDLTKVAGFAGPLSTVVDSLQRASSALAAVRSGWVVGPVSSRLAKLTSSVARAENSARLAEQAVTDAPSLLGAEGTRHYFVAFMDPPESRGLGGLLVWYGILTADHGHVSLTADGDPGTLAQQLAAIGGGHITGPADYLARYGRFHPERTVVDVPYAPDLPTDTTVMSQLYAELGHPPIDGMLVLDPKSIASILSLTGPVQVAGLGTVDGANAAQILEEGQYAAFPGAGQQQERKAALSAALEEAAQQLTHDALPNFRTLASDLAPDVKTGDLLFWSTHPPDQPLLEATGLAGRFPSRNGGDLLSVITQNSANNKVDAYLQRRVDYRVTYDPGRGRVSGTVTLQLHNSAPTSGLPPEVIGSRPSAGLRPGGDQLWFSVYSPLNLVGARIDSRPVTVTGTPELGVTAYSGFVDVAAGATVTVTVDLAGSISKGPYRLVLHDQPTVIPDQQTVTVTPTPGWHPKGSDTWTPAPQWSLAATFGFGR